MQAYEELSNISLGPITQQHASIHQTRQPDGTEFVMSTDNTTRQAQFLDEQRNEAAHENGGGDEEQNRKTIRIEINGCWIDVRVDENSLRQALGLPPHNIFQSGIFNEYVHNETVGPDVEDTDHGATEPPASAPLDAGTDNSLKNNHDNDEQST